MHEHLGSRQTVRSPGSGQMAGAGEARLLLSKPMPAEQHLHGSCISYRIFVTTAQKLSLTDLQQPTTAGTGTTVHTQFRFAVS